MRVVAHALGEPERDLALGALDGIATVDDVAADVDAEVSADGAVFGSFGDVCQSTRVRSCSQSRLPIGEKLVVGLPRFRGKRVGRPDDLASSLHDVLALPDHSAHGGGADVLNQAAEEGLAREVLVVLLSERLLDVKHLKPPQGEAPLLEARDDRADEAPLDAVGLDHYVGPLVVTHV